MTQAVKTDLFGDAGFAELYARYATDTVTEFRRWCQEAVQTRSISSVDKKNGFCRDLNAVSSKDRMVKKVTDFMLAGGGLKVIKTR